MDFFERLSEHLLEKLEFQSATVNSEGKKEISFKPLEDNELGIAVLDAPSSTNNRYFDRARSYEWMVQILVKNTNQQQAFLDAMAIYQHCDDLPRKNNKTGELITIISENRSFQFISGKGYTMPRMIEKTAHNAYIYSFLLNFELFIDAKN